ncbi:MAG: VCBS repeat-containing protein [Bacteroidota bacterium]
MSNQLSVIKLKLVQAFSLALYLHILLFLFIPLLAKSQSFSFQVDNSIKVFHQGRQLSNAWAGGINAGQFSTIHLNADTIPDLVVFDRTNSKLTTFLAVKENGLFAYRHAPVYERQFPDMRFWMLLVDYDHDGRKDIFTHTNLGIQVYRNTTVKGRELAWEVAKDAISTHSFSGLVNLQVGASDIPALVDVDNDGDIDILTYDFVGSYIEYHQNQSVEKYGHAQGLEFKRVNTCWGNFEEGTSCGDYDFTVDCQATGFLEFRPSSRDSWVSVQASTTESRIQHAGSTLLALDLDGDRDKDILIGDVSCDNIFQMTNHGTPKVAIFRSFQGAFPAHKPIDFPTFPATYFEDVDFDGVKDLLAAPNVFGNEGGRINFSESAWLYHNQGSDSMPSFEFRQTDFLQHTMVDLGENSAPAFADYDADGDLDMFVGNAGLPKVGISIASIALFENTGTLSEPVFAWRTDDYLQLSSLKWTQVRPLFADINQDGKLDFCFAGGNNQKAQLNYFLNTASSKKPFRFNQKNVFTLSITIELADAPCFADLDGDGDADLLLGKGAGNLECYQNAGSKKKVDFRLENSQCGSIESTPTNRNLAVAVSDLNKDGKLDLCTSNRQGQLCVYPAFTENMIEFPAPIMNPLPGQATHSKLGSLLTPAIADLNGDGLPEIVLGTNAGGLIYLKSK